MAISTFVGALSSRINPKEVDSYFIDNQELTLSVLQELFPEGQIKGGRFHLSSIEGGSGDSFDFNFDSGDHVYGDHATSKFGKGLTSFLSSSRKISLEDTIKLLVSSKWLDKKAAKKHLSDKSGNPLILPIPDEYSSWEYVLEQKFISKDRGMISGHWPILDTDGSLLGYKYRVDGRGSKEIHTITFRSGVGWTKKFWQKGISPAYGLDKLGSSPNIRVLFVEGERTADRAQEILGDKWKVLSYSGVSASEKLWLPSGDWWGSVEVVIWPDNDEPGLNAAQALANSLARVQKPREIRLVNPRNIVGLPPKWDLGDWNEESNVDIISELSHSLEMDSWENEAQNWVYVAQEHCFHNLRDRSLVLSPTSFDLRFTRFAEKSLSPSKKFAGMPMLNEVVEGLDFVPGGETILTSGRSMRYLNEWYPGDVLVKARELAESGIPDEIIEQNAQYFIQHVHRICGEEIVEPDNDHQGGFVEGTEGRELSDALFYYFSQIIQRPMDKRGWVPTILSEENGTGKSYFQMVMAAILGGARSKVIQVSDLESDYHDWKNGTLFYELSEARSKDSTKVYDLIKKTHSYRPFTPRDLDDRTSHTTQLNIKSKAQRAQRDFLNGYITSNDLLPLALANTSGKEESDRRLLVIRCHKVLTEEQIFNLITDELNNRAEWIGAWLLRFKPKFKWNESWAPMTAHKRFMLGQDRIRAETRAEKTDAGRYIQFINWLSFARRNKIGNLRRKMFTHKQVLNVYEANVKGPMPFDEDAFEKAIALRGFVRGPEIEHEGVMSFVYSDDETCLKWSDTEILKELTRDINGVF